MNKRVRERMTALEIDNIALAPVFMSWSFDVKSGRNPDEWWEPDIYDFMGVDIYAPTVGTSVLQTGESIEGGPRWSYIRKVAEERGVELAVGEWGVRGDDDQSAQIVLEWYEHAINSHKDGQGARVIGLSAFDSGQNSPNGSWLLQGKRLEMFHQLMGDPRTIKLKDF
ncbi:MAG: hypothetical protein WD267_09260 [Balneolales bacterium]